MTELKNRNDADVIVRAEGKSDSLYWGFNRTGTGQLDFCGKLDGITDGVLAARQTLDGSSYFSSAWYTYADEALWAKTEALLPAGTRQKGCSTKKVRAAAA